MELKTFFFGEWKCIKIKGVDIKPEKVSAVANSLTDRGVRGRGVEGGTTEQLLVQYNSTPDGRQMARWGTVDRLDPITVRVTVLDETINPKEHSCQARVHSRIDRWEEGLLKRIFG